MSSLHVVCIRSVNMNVGAFFILLIQSGSDETSRAYGRAINLSVVPFLVSLSGFKPFLCFCPFFSIPFISFQWLQPLSSFVSVVSIILLISVSGLSPFWLISLVSTVFLTSFIGFNCFACFCQRF